MTSIAKLLARYQSPEPTAEVGGTPLQSFERPDQYGEPASVRINPWVGCRF